MSFREPDSQDEKLGELKQSPGAAQLPEQFEILGQIGSGGMGIVYKARNKFTDRIVAIKMLPASAYSEESMMRFQREAKAIGSFSHPHAVALYDFGLCADLSPYFVMEFVTGTSLDDILNERGRLHERFVIDIFIQVADVAKSGNIGLAQIDAARKTDLADAEKLVLDRFGLALAGGQVGHVVGSHKELMLSGPRMSPFPWNKRVNDYAVSKQELEALSKK